MIVAKTTETKTTHFEYTTTVEDYIAFNLQVGNSNPALVRMMHKNRLVCTLAVPLLLLVLILLLPEFDFISALVALFSAMIVSWLTSNRIWRWLYARNIRRLAAHGNAGPEGRTRLSINDERLTEEISGVTSTVTWDRVERIEETPDHAFVYVGPMNSIIIPKRERDGLNAIAAINSLR